MVRVAKPVELTEQGRLLASILGRIENPRKVAGLDLSLRSSGMAVVKADGSIRARRIRTVAVPGRLRGGPGAALALIARGVLDVAAGADLVVIESPFLTINDGSKIVAAHAAMDIALEAAGWDIPIVEVAPRTLKVFMCGTSNLPGKSPTMKAAADLFGYRGTSDDEAEAVGLAELGWALLGRPLVNLPPSHLRAVATVRNPGAGKAAKARRRAKVKAAASGAA